MKNRARSLGRWTPVLAGAILGTPSFGVPTPPSPIVISGYVAASVLQFQAGVTAATAELKEEGYSIGSFSAATPLLSYPSAGGLLGYQNAAAQAMGLQGLAAHFGGAGIGVGTIDSAVTGLSAKNSTGNFYLVGYGDEMNGTYEVLEGYGQFKSSGSANLVWSGSFKIPFGFTAGVFDSAYTDVSADGSVAVGYSVSTLATNPFATTLPNGGPIELPFVPGVTGGRAITINGDGTVIVTDTPDPFSNSNPQTGSLTLNYYGVGVSYPGPESAGKFPGSVATDAARISLNGNAVVGADYDLMGNSHSYEFNASTNTFIDLGANAPADSQLGQAFDTNADGSEVVGFGAHGTNGYYWTQAGGLQTLSFLTGEGTCVAEAISSDSALIGGASFDANLGGAGIAQIWLWDGTGYSITYNLQSLLTGMGQDTTGWVLNQVIRIVPNSDGSYLIAGNGLFNGVRQAFVIELDLPAVVATPAITFQPASQAVPAGATAVFTVVATGATSYQWLKNGIAISGATAASLTLAGVQATDAGTYAVLIANAGGSLQSANAGLTVNPAGVGPTFVTQPVSQTIWVGGTLVFNAPAAAASTPSYQWTLNGSNLAGATTSRLVLTDATAANEGAYVCVATASGVSTTSNPAYFSVVQTTNIGRLVNLSVNTTAGKSQVLTIGFVVGGTGTSGAQNLLLRATGPALQGLGVANTLADPTLTVFSGSTVVASNDNWGAPASNQAAVTAADTATFAFPLTNPASLDAALVASLAAASYTAQISGNTAVSGTTLAEVYDNTPTASYTLATPRLINLSSNNQIAAKGSMTAGFVIGGTTAKTVLIRATGPALTALGVAGAIPDPQLALHTTVNGADTILASNAGWGGDPQITAVSNAVFAFPLTNPASKDSVVLTTLAPGSYTALASSVTGAAGVVLIEIYEVP